MLFINVVLPVFLIVLSGYFLGRKLTLDSTTLTNLSLYVLTPALVFSALLKNPISIDLGSRLALYMMLYTALMLGVGWLTAIVFRIKGDSRQALIIFHRKVSQNGNFLPITSYQMREV